MYSPAGLKLNDKGKLLLPEVESSILKQVFSETKSSKVIRLSYRLMIIYYALSDIKRKTLNFLTGRIIKNG